MAHPPLRSGAPAARRRPAAAPADAGRGGVPEGGVRDGGGSGAAGTPAGYAPPRPGAAIAVIAGLCILIEGLLMAADAGLIGPPTLRTSAYTHGAFWNGLLADWRANYPGQPALMFLTYAWLHGDFWHMAGNVMTLAYLAPVVAARAGTGGMVAVYLAAIPGGAAAFALLSASTAPMVGASGAVFGLAGAWQAHEWSRRRAAGAGTVPVLRTVAALVALNVALWWAMDGLLAWETHAGGFVAGWAMAAGLERRRGGPPAGAGPEGRDAPPRPDGSGGGGPGEPPPFRRAHLARGRRPGRGGAARMANAIGWPAARRAAGAALLALLAALPGPDGAAAQDPPAPSAGGADVLAIGPDGWLDLPPDRAAGPPLRVRADPALAARPVLGPAPDQDPAPTARAAPEARGYALLRDLAARGLAAGNAGDVYENRDRGHSLPRLERFPQLARLRRTGPEGGPLPRGDRSDYGLAGPLPWSAPTIGNTSAAIRDGPLARSLPRAALTMDARGAPAGTLGESEALRAAAAGYRTGRLHVYPEHRDHDAAPDPRDGQGGADMIPANLPYWIITQGSSGSDRTTVEALAAILAALRPETKARLVEEGLIAPTLQALYRLGYVRATPARPDAYLTGLAHPTAFRAGRMDLGRMVAAAAALAPDGIPPAVTLEVVEEDVPDPEVDPVAALLGEALHDGPHAVARVWRSLARTRAMTVSADATRDPNGRDLRFEWRLLRGDPGAVRIAPSADGRSARIEIDLQGARVPAQDAPPGRRAPPSARVDIGVFALNGAALGMPGMISVLMPDHEARSYEAGPLPVEVVRSPAALAAAGADAASGPEGGPRPRADIRRAVGVRPDPLLWPFVPWRELRGAAARSPRVYELPAEGGPARVRIGADGRALSGPRGPVVPPAPLVHRLVRGPDGLPMVAFDAAP